MSGAGKLNKRVKILQPATVQNDDYGTSEKTWSELDEVWCSVRDVLPSRGETLADGLNMAKRPARVRIRWREDVTTAMRFQIGSRVLQIIAGPAQVTESGAAVGEYAEFMAEELTTKGDGS